MALAKPVNGNSYDCARAAGLRYVSDAAPGIVRRRRGKAFHYRHADGGPVRDRRTLGRIRALAIPPAWRDVWICGADDGHLQATGRDARQRKQYRYHQRWREVRDETKYGRLIPFAAALPRIRRRVARDDARTHWQRGVRAQERIVRPHHPARAPGEGARLEAQVPLSRQERCRARD